MIEIPIKAGAKNAHSKVLQRLGDNLFEFHFNFLAYQDKPMWVMDIYIDGALVCAGVNLAVGGEITETDNLADDIGRFFFVGRDVTLDNVGIENHLVWLPTI